VEEGGALKETYFAEKLWAEAWRQASSRMVAEEEEAVMVMVGKEERGLRGLGLRLGFWRREEGGVAGWREEEAIDENDKQRAEKRYRYEVERGGWMNQHRVEEVGSQ